LSRAAKSAPALAATRREKNRLREISLSSSSGTLLS
jgi:hypothetical protein